MADTSKKALFSWALYDWANQAYFTMIQTFIFATYFANAIAENANMGQSWWSFAVAATGILIAITAPYFGAIADQTGRRKPWVLTFTLLSVIACGMLWFAAPGIDSLWYALIIAAIATFGAEYGLVFYNAMLPDLVPEEMIGRWSGWGWGLGYVGGILCLVIALFAFVIPEGSWLGLNPAESEHVRATFVLAAVWYGLFSIPFFMYTPDTPSKGVSVKEAARRGISELKKSIKQVREFKNIVRFLIARMIYNDGVVTIFALGGVYATGTFGMDGEDILYFGIGLNITAGIGAFAFAWLDDRLGSKVAIISSIIGLTIPFVALLIVETTTAFIVWALIMGIFVGPVQSASRSLMSRLAPTEMRTQVFGLYALSGKATAWIAPILVGWVTIATGNERLGMAAILIMLVLGCILMFKVEEKTTT